MHVYLIMIAMFPKKWTNIKYIHSFAHLLRSAFLTAPIGIRYILDERVTSLFKVS